MNQNALKRLHAKLVALEERATALPDKAARDGERGTDLTNLGPEFSLGSRYAREAGTYTAGVIGLGNDIRSIRMDVEMALDEPEPNSNVHPIFRDTLNAWRNGRGV